MTAPTVRRKNPLTRSKAGLLGIGFLTFMLLLCLGSLPWTLGSRTSEPGVPRYNAGLPRQGRLPPLWVPHDQRATDRAMAAIGSDPALTPAIEQIAADANMTVPEALAQRAGPVFDQLRTLWPSFVLGSDQLGRSLWLRVLTGGGISLLIGIAAALISVAIGTVYGAIAGYAGGKTDAILMRIVDVLYGLPYILLVVLLAVASDAMLDEYVSRSKARAVFVENAVRQVMIEQAAPAPAPDRAAVRVAIAAHPDRFDIDTLREQAYQALPPREIAEPIRRLLDVLMLLLAIAAVSWLTMARVIRGQVLSLKNQPFVEAARAMGAPPSRIFLRHLLPNLLGPIVVYATLAVPQAILQESFLSFLGIGVKPPLPSWGNLAAEGLAELNTFRSHWWLLLFPCLLLGLTLLALNFVGEGLREAFDPRRSRR